MKNTIFQCVTAIICVVAISVTGMLGVQKLADAKIEAAEIAAEAAGSVSTDAPAGDVSTDAPATDDPATDAPATDDPAVDAPATDDPATDAPAADTPTDAPAADKPADNGPKAPSTAAEITAYYNNAINKVVSSKAGFKKVRTTEMHNLDGGALLKIQLVVDMVNDFLGVGSDNWDNAKGKQENLSKASLTAADVKQASCADKNGIYTITMTLKDGNSSANASGNSDNSPLQRSGVFAGKGDKKAYDYKNSENIHTAINGVDNCTAESAIEKVTNAKITAVIDSKTGKLQSLTVSWDWYVELTKVKYTVVSINSAKGNATTTVKLTNVQW